jgi:4-carboxymuconolactone decarboxylase
MSDAGYQPRNPKADKIVRELFPRTGPGRLAKLQQLDPEFRQILEDVVFGGLYAREVLDQKTRELCALAALTVLGRNAQIRTHILASLNAGASRAEIQEVIIQMTVYGGFPASLGGLEVMGQVWGELDETGHEDR